MNRTFHAHQNQILLIWGKKDSPNCKLGLDGNEYGAKRVAALFDQANCIECACVQQNYC